MAAVMFTLITAGVACDVDPDRSFSESELELGEGQQDLATVDSVPVGTPGVVAAIALPADYGDHVVAQAEAEAAAANDPVPFLTRLAALTTDATSLLLVEPIAAPSAVGDSHVQQSFAVIENLGGAPVDADTVTVEQYGKSGRLTWCGDLIGKTDQRYAVLVEPIGAGAYRLVRRDEYYNGWFYDVGDGYFRIDRGPTFHRDAFQTLVY